MLAKYSYEQAAPALRLLLQSRPDSQVLRDALWCMNVLHGSKMAIPREEIEADLLLLGAVASDTDLSSDVRRQAAQGQVELRGKLQRTP